MAGMTLAERATVVQEKTGQPMDRWKLGQLYKATNTTA